MILYGSEKTEVMHSFNFQVKWHSFLWKCSISRCLKLCSLAAKKYFPENVVKKAATPVLLQRCYFKIVSDSKLWKCLSLLIQIQSIRFYKISKKSGKQFFKTILSPYLQNCFKYFLIYILWHLSQKIREEKLTKFVKIFELYQVFMNNFLSKWKDIHKEFWIISLCDRMFQYYWSALKVSSLSFFFYLLTRKDSTII